MKIKSLHIVSAAAFIIAAQLLFFWLIPVDNKLFAATYPFYSVMTVAHTALTLFLDTRYHYPAAFAPTAVGGAVVIGEMTAGILLGLFSDSLRTALFVQAIILVVYISVMALLISACSKESVDSDLPNVPIRPYTSNNSQQITAARMMPAPRKPQAVRDNMH